MVLAAVAGAFVLARPIARGWEFVGTFLDAAARRPRALVLAFALIGAVGNAALSLAVERPEPASHDEFGYLLLADTFARGRLANPPPPMWEALESFHVAFQPTYFSKYPPAPGLLLAAGQALAGDPLVGVWLGAGLLWAALAWVALGVRADRCGVLAAFLAALAWGGGSYWTQSYWGGAVAATGGALVLGAASRFSARSATSGSRPFGLGGAFGLGAAFGLGLLILANSRPYEGLLAALPAGVLVLRVLLRRDAPGRRGFVLASAITLAPGVAAMGVYHHAVTGDALRMPYSQHDDLYAVAPQLLFASERAPPEYRHADLRDFWTGFAAERHRASRTVAGYLDGLAYTARILWRFYLGVFLVLPFLLGFAGRERAPASARWTIAAVLAGMLLVASRKVHYFAPAAPAVLAVLVSGFAALRGFAPRGRPVGTALVASLAAASLVLHALMVVAYARTTDARAGGFARERVRLVRSLEERGGRHLVVVSYAGSRDLHEEWVFNGADPSSASVVFAREMGADRDRALARALGVGHAWRLRVVDGAPAPLEPLADP